LGLLGRIIQTPCSLEPFRNAPSRQEIRTGWMKLLWLQENVGAASPSEIRRKVKRRIPEPDLPQLWILASKISQPVLREAGALSHPDWPIGCYFMAPLTKTAIIALNQRPETPDTLWLRLLGRGATQETAIREILDLPSRHPRRMPILRLLASWKVKIERTEIPNLNARFDVLCQFTNPDRLACRTLTDFIDVPEYSRLTAADGPWQPQASTFHNVIADFLQTIFHNGNELISTTPDRHQPHKPTDAHP
jgi:hypothetical protein